VVGLGRYCGGLRYLIAHRKSTTEAAGEADGEPLADLAVGVGDDVGWA